MPALGGYTGLSKIDCHTGLERAALRYLNLGTGRLEYPRAGGAENCGRYPEGKSQRFTYTHGIESLGRIKNLPLQMFETSDLSAASVGVRCVVGLGRDCLCWNSIKIGLNL